VSKMKPCPFCGSKNYRQMIHDEAYAYFRCMDCNSTSPLGGDLDAALDIWNRRPIENKLDAENKRLKTRIEKLHKIAEENTIGYEAIIESLRSENEKLKEKKGIK